MALLIALLSIVSILNIQTHGYEAKLNPDHCGKVFLHETPGSNHILKERIVGGVESKFGEWPWLVRVYNLVTLDSHKNIFVKH